MIYCWDFLFCVLPFICIVGKLQARFTIWRFFCGKNFDCEKFNSSAKSNRENFNNLSLRQNFNNPQIRHKKNWTEQQTANSGKLSHPINAKRRQGHIQFTLLYYHTSCHLSSIIFRSLKISVSPIR